MSKICPLFLAVRWVRLLDLAKTTASKWKSCYLNLGLEDPKPVFFAPMLAQPSLWLTPRSHVPSP